MSRPPIYTLVCEEPDNLAAAIIDRLIHHGRLLRFTGSSYRLAHALLHGDQTAGNTAKTAGFIATKQPTSA